MQKIIILVVFSLVVFAGCSPEEDQVPLNDYKLQAYYVVPADIPYAEDHALRVFRTILEMRNWYQAATGGLSFEFLDEEKIIEVYEADQDVAYYDGNWWELLLNEMKGKGLPVESPGTIAIIWIDGINNISTTATAQGGTGCGGDCGAAMLPIRTVLTTTTPPADMGIMLHELGHTLGLTHPVEEADLPLPPEKEPMLYSVMNQTNVRAGDISAQHGFLTTEKKILYGNPFMKQVTVAFQDFWQVNIINYPVTGPVPEPQIVVDDIRFKTVTFRTNIDDGLLYYWDFGDGTTSNEPSPTHTYNAKGLYNVTLSVTSKDFMTGRISQFLQLP